MNCTHQAFLSLTISWSLPKLISIESVMPPHHLIRYHLLLLLPSVFPSIRVLSSESILHITWPKYWSFSLSISTSSEYSGLISFRMDWLDLLAVQRTAVLMIQWMLAKWSLVPLPFLNPAWTSVLSMNTQDGSPSGWTGWISLQSRGLSRVFSNTTVQKHQFFRAQLSL